MKKTQKKIFGVLGMLSVAALTVFAALLPVPETQATRSATDHISVTVVSTAPDVNISGITSDEVTVESEQDFTVQYANVETVTVYLVQVDQDGNTIRHDLSSIAADPSGGNISYNLIFDKDGTTTGCTDAGSGAKNCTVGFGGNDPYGAYTLVVEGTDSDGATDLDTVNFYYYPVTGEVAKDGDNYYLDVNYDPNDPGTGSGGEVTTITATIYYPDGVTPLPFANPIEIPVNPDGKTRVELPFAEYGLDDGDYVVEITAYGEDGSQLNKEPYGLTVQYKASGGEDTPGTIVPDTGAPDTGGLFQNANISSTDYLITGLIIFGLVAVAGVVFISRSNKKQSKAGARRRK